MPLVEKITFESETRAMDGTATYTTILATGGRLITADIQDENETAAEIYEREVRIKMKWNQGKKTADEDSTHFMFRDERYNKVRTERSDNKTIVFVGVRGI